MERILFKVAAFTAILPLVFLLDCSHAGASGQRPPVSEGDNQDVMEGTGKMPETAIVPEIRTEFPQKPAVGTKAKCPVTGNEFTVEKNTSTALYKGQHYAFCCMGCKLQFDKHPERRHFE